MYVTDSEDEEEGAKKSKSKKKKQTEQQKQGPNTSLILTKTLAQAMRIINEQKVHFLNINLMCVFVFLGYSFLYVALVYFLYWF